MQPPKPAPAHLCFSHRAHVRYRGQDGSGADWLRLRLLTLSGLEQTVKSVGQDSIRILPVVYATGSELVARRAGVARSPRAVTGNWKPIASSTLKTVLKFGCFGLPAKAR